MLLLFLAFIMLQALGLLTSPGPDRSGPDRSGTGPVRDRTGQDRTGQGPDRLGPEWTGGGTGSGTGPDRCGGSSLPS